MPTATELLKQHLLQQQSLGVTHVAVRRLEMPAREEIAPSAPTTAAASQPSPASEPHSPAGGLFTEAAARELPPEKRAVVSPRAGQSGALLDAPGTTREEKLASLRAMAETWEPARAMPSLRKTMVFAVGDPHASLMFVGEAPGAEEEKLREPFVGPAGQKLTAIIKAMGLDRSQVYISNICKFRPAMENQGSGNRKPTAEEMRACLPFVLTEIDIIQPKVIVALGATAAEGLGIPGSVGSLRGRFHTTSGTPTMVTYHPSYLLREEKMGDGIRAKRQVWEDMLQVMEMLGLPISEKQRGYFKTK